MADRQPPPHWQPPRSMFDEPDVVDRVPQQYQYDVLRTAVMRMQTLNVGHAEMAWKLRRRDPIAAYVLVLLFAQPDPGVAPEGPAGSVAGDEWSGPVQVKATTRLWPAGPENRDLTRLLFRLEEYVWQNRLADGWALRDALTTSVDQGMRADAAWVGLAVSSLDTTTGTWAQICDTANSESNVPGSIRLLVNVATGTVPDLAWIVGDRRGLDEFGTRTVHSTHRLSDNTYDAPFRYGRAEADEMFANEVHGPILQRMAGLDQALRGAPQFARPRGLPAPGAQWRHVIQTSHGRPR